ncbi:hypothetical protein HH214_08820 [Mucilaginibacter robiniae]|uniref:Methylamine utilisation protein MauE domain-containing protein n=1 Tax=Mucilaginibacter robiniae TaxID=2728022 RepID=A0A7L5DYV0_9SPHI|nr:MauE/DoxX family redox-associated membrane protein [Mucilaginibacter robiniae]QJD95971.1 hypothetical protein HH214_08820 [Mucilaginibacter robiniae]
MATDRTFSGHIFLQLSSSLLIMLWVYAALSKLLDFTHFQQQLHKQVLPAAWLPWVAWLLPLGELLMAGLLGFARTRVPGLYASLAALIVFTVYIGLALGHVFRRVPCSCGGILEHMSWPVHLIFNLFFLALTACSIILKREVPRCITDYPPTCCATKGNTKRIRGQPKTRDPE